MEEDPPTPIEIAALASVMDDDPTGAEALVRRMSRRDRAVLTFWLTELGRIIDQVQLSTEGF